VPLICESWDSERMPLVAFRDGNAHVTGLAKNKPSFPYLRMHELAQLDRCGVITGPQSIGFSVCYWTNMTCFRFWLVLAAEAACMGPV
jgi:hypothetical protein